MASVEGEHDLLQRWLAGDGEAFGRLFEAHATSLYNLAFRLTGTPDDARDLVQNAALRALASPARCRQEGSFAGWMRRVITNLFLDSLKARRRAGRDRLLRDCDWEDVEHHARPDQVEPSPRGAAERHELQREIEVALSALDPVYRSVVVLRDVEGLSYAEIARLQDVQIETVRTRLRRARSRLREMLSKPSGIGDPEIPPAE